MEWNNGTAPTLSRRRILQASAWAAPAIVVATAIPAAAASDLANTQLRFYMTAAEVLGTGASASVNSNGVRVSPAAGVPNAVIAAGSVARITIQYTGALPTFSFLNIPWPYSLAFVKGQIAPWTVESVTATTIVLVAVTAYASAEPTIGSFGWPLDPAVRPEDGSIVMSGQFIINPGADFPDGGVLAPLMIDPNAGTGTLAGPTPVTWP